MKLTNAEKAEVLVQALPYIRQYHNRIVVVKYGGNAMTDKTLRGEVMRDVALLRQIGIKVVLVHGGGPEIDDALKRMNIAPAFEGGLRVTDKETMDVVQMVLAGKVNKDLVNLLEEAGGKAMGLCGVDGRMIEARQLDEKHGLVGEITRVNVRPVLDIIENGYVPVISSVAAGEGGAVYNVNADTVAARLAGELKATCLISMTDIRGLLRDKSDESTLIPVVNVSDAPALIREGVISGGMIPKIDCCVEAIRRGVEKVFILDGTVPHAILIEILSDEGLGTMFR